MMGDTRECAIAGCRAIGPHVLHQLDAASIADLARRAPQGSSMTQYEKLRLTFLELGIAYLVGQDEKDRDYLRIDSAGDDGMDGYTHFYHTFTFDEKGVLLGHGGWE